MKACCCRCKFWNPTAGDKGECRRYPKQSGEKFLTTWPVLSSIDWCGEFKMKPNKETKNVKVK